MRKTLSLLLVFVLMFSVLTACKEKKEDETKDGHAYGKTIYVSPNGNDENDGSKDSPLATLSGAVETMRQFRSENGLPEGGIKIEFAGGTYTITEGITLTTDDSGTEESPIVFAGAENADVLFSGGIMLSHSDFSPADDEFKSLLQTEEAKNNVIMIDLVKAGCYDIVSNTSGYGQELFVNGKRQDVARWPNGTYCTPENVDDDHVIYDENGEAFGKIYITEEQAELWRNAENIRFFGYPYYDWSSLRIKDIHISDDEPIILFPLKLSNLNSRCIYFVYNIPQELDSPGEYFWDTDKNVIYYWPKNDFNDCDVVFSQFNETPIILDGCSYVGFDSLSAKYFRNGFISGKCDNVSVIGCEIASMSASSAVYLVGNENTVKGCWLHDLSTVGIKIDSGDFNSQTIGRVVVSDNIIHDFAQIDTVYNPGIYVNGIGAYIGHNTVFNSPHVAIETNSAECIIEYNEVYDCCLESQDCGALHTMGYLACNNNIIRYNYFHDIRDRFRGVGGNAMYFDCWGRLAHVYNNLFVNISYVAIAGASCHMIDENNICINVGTPINLVWSAIDEISDFEDYRLFFGWSSLLQYDYTSQIWRYCHPRALLVEEVAHAYNDEAAFDLYGSPAYSIVRNNIRYIDENSDYIPTERELFGKETTEGQEMPQRITVANDIVVSHSAILDNVCYWEDPGFTDYENGDYTLREDSRVFRDLIGFESFDLSTVGVRASENPFK